MTRISWAILLVLVLVVAGVGGFFLGRHVEHTAAGGRFDELAERLDRLQDAAEQQAHMRERIERLEEQTADTANRVEVLSAEVDERRDVTVSVREGLERLEAELKELAPEPKEPLLVCGFDDSLAGWTAAEGQFGDIKIAGTLAITTEPAHAKLGLGAAAWSYDVGEKQVSALVRQTAFVRSIRQISFWLRSQEPTILVIELKEQDESKYHAVVDVTDAGKWQHVERATWAFQLSDDSEDENDTLDADRIVSITIIDPSGVFKGRVGPNVVYLDDLQLK